MRRRKCLRISSALEACPPLPQWLWGLLKEVRYAYCYCYHCILCDSLLFDLFQFLSCRFVSYHFLFGVMLFHSTLILSPLIFSCPLLLLVTDLKLMMDLQCLGTPLVPDRTVSSVLSAITACHGAKIDGDGEIAFT